jgi:uncharacterized protein (DUF1697 family)
VGEAADASGAMLPAVAGALGYGSGMSVRAVKRDAPIRQVALLRGVNVGGNNRVPMAQLRELLQELGYEDVLTHLQSGNAVFTTSGSSAERIERKIEEQLEHHLGLRVRVLVRTGEELARVVDTNPLPAAVSEPSRLLVTFLSAPLDPEALSSLDPTAFEPDLFGVGDREIYVWCPEGVRTIKLSYAFWEKRFGVIATARNWNTVTKLLALTQQEPRLDSDSAPTSA